MWPWRREPLTCTQIGSMLAFSRMLTADEIALVRFVWRVAHETASKEQPKSDGPTGDGPFGCNY
jgi:hypothetical protein